MNQVEKKILNTKLMELYLEQNIQMMKAKILKMNLTQGTKLQQMF